MPSGIVSLPIHNGGAVDLVSVAIAQSRVAADIFVEPIADAPTENICITNIVADVTASGSGKGFTAIQPQIEALIIVASMSRDGTGHQRKKYRGKEDALHLDTPSEIVKKGRQAIPAALSLFNYS